MLQMERVSGSFLWSNVKHVLLLPLCILGSVFMLYNRQKPPRCCSNWITCLEICTIWIYYTILKYFSVINVMFSLKSHAQLAEYSQRARLYPDNHSGVGLRWRLCSAWAPRMFDRVSAVQHRAWTHSPQCYSRTDSMISHKCGCDDEIQ